VLAFTPELAEGSGRTVESPVLAFTPELAEGSGRTGELLGVQYICILIRTGHLNYSSPDPKLYGSVEAINLV
jgi:hypothetical protein